MAETNNPGREEAAALGNVIRARRKALSMTQDELALATGVGRRFVIELEAGKPTLQLGRVLVVADAVGLKLRDLLTAEDGQVAHLPERPTTAQQDFSEDGIPPW